MDHSKTHDFSRTWLHPIVIQQVWQSLSSVGSDITQSYYHSILASSINQLILNFTIITWLRTVKIKEGGRWYVGPILRSRIHLFSHFHYFLCLYFTTYHVPSTNWHLPNVPIIPIILLILADTINIWSRKKNINRKKNIIIEEMQ